MSSPGRLLLAFIALAGALLASIPGAMAAARPAADAAFPFVASRTITGELDLSWQISAGAYLYRDSITLREASGATLAIDMPPGVEKDDPTFGPTHVLEGPGETRVRAASAPARGVATLTYQGCDATRGVCYPPQTRHINLASLTVTEAAPRGGRLGTRPENGLAAGSRDAWEKVSDAMAARPAEVPPAAAIDDSKDIASRVMALGLAPLAAAFVGFGLLLSLTPCVLPMVPVVSGMLARSGAASSGRGFLLALTYVLAMATAYGALGVVAGWSGQNLQMVLQTPWAIGAMSLIFVALALSMFGFYELKAPNFITSRLASSGGHARGSLPGAAALGFTSALIVGPCVTPPLAGALLYVSQTGDVTRGAVALSALGLGMGAPLLALGLVGPRALPRNGPWLIRVNHAFGVIFLATAIYLSSRMLPGPVGLMLWALLALGVSVFLGAFDRSGPASASAQLARAGGLVAAIYGVILLVGAASGGADPLQPLARFATPAAATSGQGSVRVVTVRATADFERALAVASSAGQSVVVDITADWCSICKQIDREVFQSPEVMARLAQRQLIRIDITRNDADSRALMQRFAVVGPPAIILMKDPTAPVAGLPKIVGAIDRAGFLSRLDQAGL